MFADFRGQGQEQEQNGPIDFPVFIPDTESPDEVKDFQAITGINQITLSWSEPQDPDFDHVELTYSPSSEKSPIINNKGTTEHTIINLNMKTNSSYTLTNQGINTLLINCTSTAENDVAVIGDWNLISVPSQASNMSKDMLTL